MTGAGSGIGKRMGRMDVVVNSAGIYQISRFPDTPLEVNCLGAVRMMQTFLPDMIDAGYGKAR